MTLYFWLNYLLGAIIHILVRGRSASQSKGYKTIDIWIRTYWVVLLARTILGGGLFALWVTGKGQVAAAMGAKLLGLEFTIPNIPVNGPTAFFFGYFVDSILDWLCNKVPFLRREIPQLNNGALLLPVPQQGPLSKPGV